MYSPNNKTPIVRHLAYFLSDGDIIIKVDDKMFRVHKYFLTRESKHFRSMFIPTIPCRDPPGSSETNPVVLEDANSEGFADLLWVFYNPGSVDKWKRILKLAQQWGFLEVESLCVRELEQLAIPPVEKIRIYQDFNLDSNLLHSSYVALTIRDDPLDMEEGEQLQLSTSLKIAQARELARRALQTNGQTARIQESEVESVIKNVFMLQGSAPPTAGTRPNPTSDDHVERTTGKKKNNKAY